MTSPARKPKERPDPASSNEDSWEDSSDASTDERLAHLIKQAYRGVQRSLQIRLLEFDTPSGHWSFLRVLWQQDGLTQRKLSELAGFTPPTTFAAVTAMEKLGFVTRRMLPDNRRNVHVFLTPKGLALKGKLVPLAEQVNAAAVRGVDPADVAATRRTLLAVIANLARDEEDALAAERRMPSTQKLSSIIDRSARRRAVAKRSAGKR